jgi:hypothetical protein
MFTQPLRKNEPAFDFGGLGDRIPDNLPGGAPTIPINKGNNGGADLSQQQKDAAADAELARQAAEKAKQQGQGQQGQQGQGESATEPEETVEQIQAKLDVIAAKEEKDYTPEDKAYIEKYTAQEETPIDAAKNLVVQKYALELGEDKKYDNTPEGLTTLIDEVTPMVAEKMLEEHFATIPHMAEFYNHVRQGRGLETFLAKNQKPIYDAIDIKEPSAEASEAIVKQSKDNQRQMIRLDLQSKGVDTETIETIIDLADSGGKLFEKATTAKAALKVKHEASIQAQLQAEEDAIKADQLEAEAVHKKVVSMLDKNDFDGLSIPPADLKIFKDALLKVDSNGRSLIDYKKQKLTLAQRLFLDYIVLKDFKGIGTPKSPAANKVFQFQSASQQNNARAGGRLTGANKTEHANVDIKGLNLLFKQNK